MSRFTRHWKLALPLGVLVILATVIASSSVAASSAKTVRVAIMTDCKGGFGFGYEPDIGGAQAALANYAHGKVKDPKKPSAGMTGIRVGTTPIQIVGYGCGDDTVPTAVKETRRLMEQLKADVMIGPLSGDEAVYVANYAKTHPSKTFIIGTAGSQDPTLQIAPKNVFRYHGDGAQWNAGLGDLAHNKLGWKTAAVVADDYSFAWTSAAGFIAEFCAVGGKVTKRVFPPLNTTDYSSYAQQMPTDVDGTFVAVGGAGLIPFLKAYEQAHGPIDGKKFIGNLFWGTPGQFEQLSARVAGAYAGGAGTAGDLATKEAQKYSKRVIGKWFKTIPPFGAAAPQASSTFTFGYFINTWGLIKGLQAVKGDISGGQKKLQKVLGKVSLQTGYGPIKLDKNRQGIIPVYYQQLYTKNGKLAVKTVGYIPNVDQTFGGTFSSKTPPPGRTFPPCVKRSLPWVGKTQHPKVIP